MKKFLTILASTIAIATPTLFLEHSTLLAQAQTQESQLKNHAIGNLTFKAPRNWLENPRGASANSLELHNKKFPDRGGGFAPKGLIRVVATISEEDLETATETKPNSRVWPKTTTKTERLTINGKKAVRLYEDYNDGFPAGIVTYVATGKKETIMLGTFYSDSDTEKQVQQIQDSIRITQ
ncbi:hypothetical protein IQ269_10380 [Tychonema sp. LEGE 07199]|uniref:hypothetical protein n=1 Tax=unclassified Tychonema TaxID=2642144 RepID=UPI00187F5F06|nr:MULTISPECIES: hypothetical protein [unclassified Tychonema]MBE9121215.1 hypothetical protein [Tychonema sp. LEGE 07199]MBE9133524.1 hypothetical protein [Tychonema sp. LEGE 07196]